MLIFLFVTSLTWAQNITVNPDLKIDSTDIKITSGLDNNSFHAYSSYDLRRNDSLSVMISTIGVTVEGFRIIIGKEVNVEIILYSDAPEYSGSHTKDIEFESFELEVNTLGPKEGERFMGKFVGESVLIPFKDESYRMTFSGEFSHIIGTLMVKRRANEEYRILDDH